MMGVGDKIRLLKGKEEKKTEGKGAEHGCYRESRGWWRERRGDAGWVQYNIL